jgi:hypothetical protein
MGTFGVIHGVEVKVERAFAIVDSLGYFWCEPCWIDGGLDRKVDSRIELEGPYTGMDTDSSHEDNLCCRCGCNPWDLRKQEARTATVEYFGCKIF